VEATGTSESNENSVFSASSRASVENHSRGAFLSFDTLRFNHLISLSLSPASLRVTNDNVEQQFASAQRQNVRVSRGVAIELRCISTVVLNVDSSDCGFL